MKMMYGVLSATPINKRLKNGYHLYDWVMRRKCFPDFCMRAISGEGAITAAEIEFLRSKDCKIGLVATDLTEAAVSTANGIEDAVRAVESAKRLGAPQDEGIAIFAHILPDWSVNYNWMSSFARTIHDNGYVPGFIGNTDSSKNCSFDRQYSRFVQTTKDEDSFGAILMATEPKRDGFPPEDWAPYCPSVLQPSDVHLWACGKTKFDDIAVDDVYVKDDNVLNFMW